LSKERIFNSIPTGDAEFSRRSWEGAHLAVSHKRGNFGVAQPSDQPGVLAKPHQAAAWF